MLRRAFQLCVGYQWSTQLSAGGDPGEKQIKTAIFTNMLTLYALQVIHKFSSVIVQSSGQVNSASAPGYTVQRSWLLYSNNCFIEIPAQSLDSHVKNLRKLLIDVR